MPNNLDSNITRQLMKKFIPAFEAQRVVSKTVDTQMFQGKFEPSSGDVVDVKRPHQYLAQRTSGGDISAGTDNTITSGKATATVQDYITVPIPWTNKEEALELDQLQAITDPAVDECVQVLETSFQDYMIKNAALSVGTPGVVPDAWSDVAVANSLMSSLGVPAGEKYYVMNPFNIQNLAGAQTGLSADPARLVQTAWENAQIPSNFAGLRALASNSMSTYTSGATTDRIGALTAAPTATYLAAKDTMVQTLAYDSLSADTANALRPGDILEFTGTGTLARSYINPRTRKTVFGADGSPVKWRCVVISASTTVGTAGTVVVAGPAILEANGQYNNISAALAIGDVFSVLGTANVEYQPNLFYHRAAFSIAFVKLPKLYSTDTIATTKDGISIRCSKYADGDANTQKVRFDILPAFGVMNPFWAGKGFGL